MGSMFLKLPLNTWAPGAFGRPQRFSKAVFFNLFFKKKHNLIFKQNPRQKPNIQMDYSALVEAGGGGWAGAGLPLRHSLHTRVTGAAGKAKPWSSGRPAFFVLSAPSPRPQGTQASRLASQSEEALSSITGLSYSQGSLSPEEGPGECASLGYLSPVHRQ